MESQRIRMNELREEISFIELELSSFDFVSDQSADLVEYKRKKSQELEGKQLELLGIYLYLITQGERVYLTQENPSLDNNYEQQMGGLGK